MGRRSSAKRAQRERLVLDRQALEARRIRTVEQIVNEGLHPEVAARVLGVSRAAVYGWVKKYKEGGSEALRARAVSGRPPKLSEAQQEELFWLVVDNNPEQLRFEFALWTRQLVRELIWQRFGVDMSEKAVGRMLRRWGLSPQRPLRRAYEQDPDAARRWKEADYPRIRDLASEAGGTVWFADEATLRSDYHSGTTWAPVGQTPVVAATGRKFKVNMISAVTPGGRVYFDLFDGNMNGTRFIDFCKKLLRENAGRPVFLIVDNAPVHHARAVKKHVESTDGQLQLFFLPPYSPELNPDEWVWKNIKHDRIGKLGITSITSKQDLWTRTVQAFYRLRLLPETVLGFFRDPDLAYITNQTDQQSTDFCPA